jgi:DNA-directed RNA polymerase subunit M/transcription elongation factor TFIIS
MNCPKCDSSKIDSFLRPKSKEMIPFKECTDCGYEWHK